MKTKLTEIDDHDLCYQTLMFVCPGCQTPYTFADGTEYRPSGLHALAVNSPQKQPSWKWDGNLELPTLSPSILSHIQPYGEKGEALGICHSFLKAGIFEYLSDCTHEFADQHIPLPDLPTWVEEK